MASMFRYCKALTSLNLSGFDTSSVTSTWYMFRDCDKLTELDLSSFNTSKVTNMNSMFGNCTTLKTIYVSELWDVSNVPSSDSIFYNCQLLAGAVSYDRTKTDKTMANYTTGYLTYKKNTN